jgi:hypothetical protein
MAPSLRRPDLSDATRVGGRYLVESGTREYPRPTLFAAALLPILSLSDQPNLSGYIPGP